MKKRKIDQIQATAKMITALSKQDGFISINQDLREKIRLHLTEDAFIKQFKNYNTDENYSENYTKLYIDLPKIHIFALQTKEV